MSISMALPSFECTKTEDTTTWDPGLPLRWRREYMSLSLALPSFGCSKAVDTTVVVFHSFEFVWAGGGGR